MIDFARGEEVATARAVERLVEWTAPAREALGLEVELPERTGPAGPARRSRRARSIEDVYRGAVEETKRTYAPERVNC